MNSILEAQSDMRKAYYSGAAGVISSGTAWLVAGLIAFFVTPRAGIFTLILGGMLIFPVSILICKAVGCSGKHQKGNPLAPLAITGTIWMVLSIPVAFGAALFKLEWFFPAMLLVIGSRYLTFQTLYGLRIYLIFGGVLIAAGTGLIFSKETVFIGALTGALIEYIFGAKIYISHKAGET